MVSGTDNANGHRKTPWQFNVCSRKKLEGWSACPSPKIGAEGPDRAVLEVVNERVLTTDFIDTLVPEVNRQLAENTSDSLESRTREKQHELAEIDRAINVLDLAQQFGATSAGPSLVEKAAAKARLLA